MGSRCKIRGDCQSKVEQLFAEPHAADILLILLEKDHQMEDELETGACGGESSDRALEFLVREELVSIEGMGVRLTSKGEKTAEVLEKLESLFSGRDSQALR